SSAVCSSDLIVEPPLVRRTQARPVYPASTRRPATRCSIESSKLVFGKTHCSLVAQSPLLISQISRNRIRSVSGDFDHASTPWRYGLNERHCFRFLSKAKPSRQNCCPSPELPVPHRTARTQPKIPRLLSEGHFFDRSHWFDHRTSGRHRAARL